MPKGRGKGAGNEGDDRRDNGFDSKMGILVLTQNDILDIRP